MLDSKGWKEPCVGYSTSLWDLMEQQQQTKKQEDCRCLLQWKQNERESCNKGKYVQVEPRLTSDCLLWFVWSQLLLALSWMQSGPGQIEGVVANNMLLEEWRLSCDVFSPYKCNSVCRVKYSVQIETPGHKGLSSQETQHINNTVSDALLGPKPHAY